MNVTTTLNFSTYQEFFFSYNGRAIKLTNNDEKEDKKRVLYYQLGVIGKELLSISRIDVDSSYLEDLINDFKEGGIGVENA